MREITEEELQHWETHGYVLVEHLLSRQELQDARQNMLRYLPTWEEYHQAPERYSTMLAASNNWPVRAFPFAGMALNNICTHPVLISLARRLLRTDNIALSHSRLRGKYARTGNFEQNLHVDYGNNTLAYPNEDAKILDLPCIIYYSDVTPELGPTYVVSQQHTRGQLLVPRSRGRDEYPDLYRHEVPAVLPAGSALLYSMRTFHRGSAMIAAEGARFSHHMSWRNGDCRWTGQGTFQHDGGRQEMDHFIEHATPEQRAVVGFPPVGHPYWSEETLSGVAARYPGMDLTPYRMAVLE